MLLFHLLELCLLLTKGGKSTINIAVLFNNMHRVKTEKQKKDRIKRKITEPKYMSRII